MAAGRLTGWHSALGRYGGPDVRIADAWSRHIDVEGFPVCHPDDIIASKAATNRVKDRESLPRLRSFRDYWIRTRS
jgi:hypothetical protein